MTKKLTHHDLNGRYMKLDDILKGRGVVGRWSYYAVGCMPGWVPLIEQMIDRMFEEGWDGTGLYEIKQKFGTLRVWLEGPHPPEVYDMVHDHEAMGQNTCELCGSTGFIRTIAVTDRKGRMLWGHSYALCDGCWAGVEQTERKK